MTLMERVNKHLDAVRLCRFQDYKFQASTDYNYIFIYAEYDEPDTVTGKIETQKTREWVTPVDGSISQTVATCFKCVLTSMEHRTREWFLYKNRAIYQPHYDVEQLAAICEERA